MKRKLIAFEAFQGINENSLSNAQTELVKAEDVLAKALNASQLKMHCFGKEDVTYQTLENTYVHATYQIKDNSIIFENITELVVSDETAKVEARNLIGSMVENLLSNDESKAGNALDQYLSNPTVRRELLESCGAKKSKKCKMMKSETKRTVKLAEHANFKKAPKKLKQWCETANNVINYLDFQEFGPIMNESQIKTDEKGNVVSVKIPTAHARNEGKIIALNFKHMVGSEVKVLRGKMKGVSEQTAFCHAISDLRKANAISDDQATTEIIEAIVRKWPDLIYLTQKELAENIAQVFETINYTNYDDDICNFLAEGILRTAVDAFSDRVHRVARLSGATLDKEATYESFQTVAEKFYTSIDESGKLEMQIFADLYNSLVEVHNHAKTEGNEALRSEVNGFLKELYAVLQEEQAPSNELAEEVAVWLRTLVETNVEDWEVSNTPHQTISGDHPQMTKNASTGYAPSKDFSGNWGGTAPVSNGKGYHNGLEDEMRNNAWGNIANNDTWPSLDNPYIPKASEFKMKEKSAVDDGDNDWSRFNSKDTWPNLENPYAPKSPWDNKKTNNDNLVVDK